MDSSSFSLLSISDDLEAGFSGTAALSRNRRAGAAAEPPHFLDTCFFCKRRIGSNRDIFMYRGDTPFCSELCRQEQIEIDETGVKRRGGEPARGKKVSTSMKKEIPVRTGSAVVVG